VSLRERQTISEELYIAHPVSRRHLHGIPPVRLGRRWTGREVQPVWPGDKACTCTAPGNRC